MRKSRSLLFVMIFTITMDLLSSPAKGATAGVNHTRKIKSYTGPETCLACHSISKMGSNLALDIFNSAHFQLRTTNPKIDIPAGGSHGMMDRACGLPGTTMMAGNYAGIATKDGVIRDDGCGDCHLGYKPPHLYLSSADAIPDIDCLRCHAAVYGREEWDDPANQAIYGTNPSAPKRMVIPLSSVPRYADDRSGRLTWSQDRTLKTAQSVGQLPLAKFCERCHEHGLSRYKRATPFTPATDVHAAANPQVECYQCHAMQQHKIARGNYVTDGMASDLPSVEVNCTIPLCHGTAPHVAANAADLNKHTTNVSCEVCHIPAMEGALNIWKRTWGPSTLDPITGLWQSTPPVTTGEYPGLWDAYSEYHDLDGNTTSPSIRWFNGGASMLAQPYGSYADRVSAGGTSKLFAFKPFTSGMLFDAAWLPGPPADYNHVNDTWPYSMKSYYEMNWAKFLLFGFVDPSYPTPASYWGTPAGSNMAAMLNNFPMMLQFSRSVFLSEGGTLIGAPLPGTQSASSYPGIAKAINVGMGTIGIDMGYCPPAMNPEDCGRGFWSGTFFSMWVPVNMDPNAYVPFEVGSFITLSHAVKGASDARLADPNYCFTCHFTADEYKGLVTPQPKRVDFARFGYPDTDENGLIDPKCEVTVIPKVSAIQMNISKTKTAETLTIVVTVINCKDGVTPVPGITVSGELSGPSSDSGLPKSFSGITGTDGTATFLYKKKVLNTGTYTFTTSVPSAASGTITK